MFQSCIADLIDQPDILAMEDIKQHTAGFSCLDHCLFVAYCSFLICKTLGLNSVSAARAGLMHDLYLCNWKDTDIGVFKRLLVHPDMAVKNAEKYNLSDLEKDIILKHMWPVTITNIPLHGESVVVNIMDKCCTMVELFQLYRVLGVVSRLSVFNKRKSATI